MKTSIFVKIVSAAVAVLSLSLFACKKEEVKTQAVQKGTVFKISGEEAHNIMQELKDFVILDVRTEQEFKEQHIEGAILIPNTEIKNRAAAELKNKEQVIFVYCRSGGRSARAAAELADMGYTNVYDFGGILDWKFGVVTM